MKKQSTVTTTMLSLLNIMTNKYCAGVNRSLLIQWECPGYSIKISNLHRFWLPNEKCPVGAHHGPVVENLTPHWITYLAHWSIVIVNFRHLSFLILTYMSQVVHHKTIVVAVLTLIKLSPHGNGSHFISVKSNLLFSNVYVR